MPNSDCAKHVSVFTLSVRCLSITERIIQGLTVMEPLSGLKSKTVRNISYIGAAQVAVLVLTLAMVAVLTRLLTPEDFGIVSIGFVFMVLFITIQDFGIAPAVIQRDTRVEDSVSVGLTLRWLIAGLAFILIAVISPTVARIYDNDALVPVLIVMSITLFIQPFGFSAYVMLNKRLEFSSIAISTIAQHATTAILAIVLAIAGLSYWSIVFGSLFGNVSNVVVLNYYGKAFRKPAIDIGLAKELFGFGSHILVASLMWFVVFNVDQLVIGKVLGLVALGVYFVAVRFGRTWADQMSQAVNTVLFPTMATIKDSLDRLKTGYIQSLRMIAIIAVLLCVGLASLAPILVSTVLGPDFVGVVLPISILSFQGLFNALITPAGNTVVAIGRPKYMSIQAIARAVLMVVFVYPAAYMFHVEGVCYLTTLLSIGVFAYFAVVLSRVFKTTVTEILAPLAAPFLSGFVTFVLLEAGSSYLPASLLSLFVLAALGTAASGVSLHLFSRGRDLRDFFSLLRVLFLKQT